MLASASQINTARLQPPRSHRLVNSDLPPAGKRNWTTCNFFPMWINDVHSAGGYLQQRRQLARGNPVAVATAISCLAALWPPLSAIAPFAWFIGAIASAMFYILIMPKNVEENPIAQASGNHR